MTNLEYGLLYSLTVFIGISIFIYSTYKKSIKEIDDNLNPFVVASVKEIQKTKGVPDKESEEVLIAYAYLSSSTPYYPEHIQAIFNVNYFQFNGPELYKVRCYLTAFSAYYGFSIPPRICLYGELTSKVYNHLKEGFALLDYEIDQERFIEQVLDVGLSSFSECNEYLMHVGYYEIASQYLEYLTKNIKLPTPYNLVNATQSSTPPSLEQIKQIVTAFSIIHKLKIPKIYSSDSFDVCVLVKAITFLQKDYVNNLQSKPNKPEVSTRVKPILKVIK